MAAASPAPSFMKQLAANEKSVRDRAVDSLRIYLRSRKEFSEIELLKLWKGLFYCMWMSDKPRNQQQLARDLADLVDVVPRETVVPFLDAFWKTMAREWNGISSLRMDKYLYLVRQYLYVSIRYLAKAGWKDSDMIDRFMKILTDTPLNAREARIPNGMRYHVLDVYLDEVEKVDNEYDAKTPFNRLLAPVVLIQKESPTRTVRERAKEQLDDERVRTWLGQGEKHAGEVKKDEDKPQGEQKEDACLGEGEDWGGFED
ncbi:uncharacterized protein PV09_09339 [Verruconis gallopava]|uniref:Ribosomal RNA-processing protein 1 n=1 Tax=Verruconis gallopava TaxID=253628 RepID=A0A0D1ZWM5_9PEZI|nr:uncharacterized protein PV09_09339 [Verruconis gallopava]KIV98892.1 hypothetical protein PV09_09339 [Verruconis gallopava]